MSVLDMALELASRGMFVFPLDSPELELCAGTGRGHDARSCKDRGKHPCVAFTKQATTDPRKIRAWFTGAPRNIGVFCGRSGLLVVDEDTPGDLARYAAAVGATVPETFTVATGRGSHYYFQAGDHELGNAEGALKSYGVNIRGRGGYVVGPGSLHASGVLYSIVDEVPPAELPTWLLDALERCDAPSPSAQVEQMHQAEPARKPRGLDAVPAVIRGPRHGSGGERHDVLMRYACSLRSRDFPLAEAEVLFRQAWERCEQPPTAVTPMTWEDAQATLVDVYDRYPVTKPRPEPSTETNGLYEPRVGGDAVKTRPDEAPTVGCNVPAAALEIPAKKKRPALNVGNAAAMADWLRDHVGTGPLAGMFLRGREIVYTACEGDDGYVALTTAGDDGPAQVRVMNKSTLASRVQYTYDCYKRVKTSTGGWVEVPAMFPPDAARVATDVPDELPRLRRLCGVVHAPVLRPDGTVLAAPGYDDATGLLYLPLGLIVPPVADTPSRQDVARAKAVLDEMTAGFNFVSADDQANYYGLLLTPVLRGIAPPPYKLAAISSPQPGSGKTLLASIARAIHGGVFRAEMPEDDRELRKQITALLTVTTGPLVHLDNVSGQLRSSTMSGLLTSPTWGDRPLGATDWVETPNDRLWMVTGNNLQLGGDLPRRTLWVNIDPGVPNPERRTDFAIRDLQKWVKDHRAELIHALLTLARAWVAAGRPALAPASSDGYSLWIDTVASILSNAGVPGVFAAPISGPEALGTDDEDWAEFLTAVHKVFGAQPWSVRELLSRVRPSAEASSLGSGDVPAIPLTSLPVELQAKARQADLTSIARPLGMWVSKNKGRWAGGYTARFVREGRGRERFWHVEASASRAD